MKNLNAQWNDPHPNHLLRALADGAVYGGVNFMSELLITKKGLESFENQIAQLTAENAELRAKLERLEQLERQNANLLTEQAHAENTRTLLQYRMERAESAIGEWEEREASCCPENVSFVDVIKTLRSEKERAEACGAAYREMIGHLMRYPTEGFKATALLANTQCGVGLLEKVKRLEVAGNKLLACFPLHDWCDGQQQDAKREWQQALAETECAK